MTVAIVGNLLLLGSSFYYWIKSLIFGYKNVVSSGHQPNRSRHKIKLLNSVFLFFNSCIPWAMYLFYINEHLFGDTGAEVFSIAFIVITGTQVSSILAFCKY